MSENLQLSEKIQKLENLLASDQNDSQADFHMPSLLKEVPSYTTDHCHTETESGKYAELGGRS